MLIIFGQVLSHDDGEMMMDWNFVAFFYPKYPHNNARPLQ